jgi:hypothetical protein
MSVIYLILAGAAGSLIKDLIEDGTLELPKRIDGKLALGFISSIIIGAGIGFLADKDPTFSFLMGYVGKSFIESLIGKGGLRGEEEAE